MAPVSNATRVATADIVSETLQKLNPDALLSKGAPERKRDIAEKQKGRESKQHISNATVEVLP